MAEKSTALGAVSQLGRMPTPTEMYADGLLMWYELCAECTAAFYSWRDAPNPGPWNDPKVQQYPQLMAFLASCRVLGPSPEEWRRTVSWQLMLIRRICTDRHAEARAAEAAARQAAREAGRRPVTSVELPDTA